MYLNSIIGRCIVLFEEKKFKAMSNKYNAAPSKWKSMIFSLCMNFIVEVLAVLFMNPSGEDNAE